MKKQGFTKKAVVDSIIKLAAAYKCIAAVSC